MQQYEIQLGDMVEVHRLLYRHVGIYAGDGNVVHNDKGLGVVLSSLNQFSDGKQVFLRKAATGDYFQRQIVANRALSLLGTKFDLLKFNCEHAASWAQSGKIESPQLQGFLAFGLIFLCVGLLVRGK